MSLVTDLMDQPGVVAAGDFAYRGDQYYHHKGALSQSETRMVSTLCRANTAAVRMEGDMLALFSRICQPETGGCGFEPTKGWVVHGESRSICVISNVYCVLDNEKASLTKVLGLMRKRLANAPDMH
jgi:roadblock/LC7 domain-containing protein